jgi:hypothetical protein
MQCKLDSRMTVQHQAEARPKAQWDNQSNMISDEIT